MLHKRLQSKIVSVLFFTLITGFSVYLHGMKENDTIASYSKKSINEIPLYLFNNPNQSVIKNRKKELLERLKNSTDNVTGKKIDQAQQYIDKLQTKEDFDWIYALKYAEELLKKNKTQFTVNDIKKFNQRVSRLTCSNPGNLRKEVAIWPMKDLDQSEKFFCSFFRAGILDAVDSMKILENKPCILKENDIYKYAQYTTMPIEKRKEIAQDLNGIDYNAWIRERLHFFPLPKELDNLLENLFSDQETKQDNPLELAAFLWFKTVRIHPFGEANKRTGRLLASVVLLQNGYLPPVFTNAEKFNDIFLNSVSTENIEDGLSKFTEFFVKAVKETQQKAKEGELLL